MNQLSGIKLLVNISLLLLSIILIISAGSNIIAYSKTSHIKVENIKVQTIWLKIRAEGFVLFDMKPALAQIDGVLEPIIEDGVFVTKNKVIGRIKDKETEVDLLSPGKGILQWARYKNYNFNFPPDLNNNSINKNEFDAIYPGEFIHHGEIVATIIPNEFAYLSLENINIPEDINTLYFDQFQNNTLIEGNIIFRGSKFVVCKVYDYLEYLLNENIFLVQYIKINGIIIADNDIVQKDGKTGIYVLNGEKVQFMETRIYRDAEKIVAEIPGTRNAITVVRTPHIATEGKIINETGK
ncbi:MAG: hypothetical protein U9Q18_05225 [Caldisericota bacterium]|nr:hypothetical protein [Caldisericota bacterium]